jgi:hypothetical protein
MEYDRSMASKSVVDLAWIMIALLLLLVLLLVLLANTVIAVTSPLQPAYV